MKYNLLPGTVLCSRNKDENQNISPGWINHLAIIVDNEQNIVEAQINSGVILTPWSEYESRQYQWSTWGVLYPLNKEIGLKAAKIAKTYIGKKYGKLASIRISNRRMNCVKVISEAYSEAMNQEIKMSIPDDILRYTTIFTDKLEKVK